MTAHLCTFLLLLVMAPLIPGVIARVKAMVAGRHGRPLLQTYHDLAKLLRKGEVVSSTGTYVFRTAPAVSLAATILTVLLLPLGASPSPIHFTGDFLLACYLLGLSRFVIILAALDCGSSFEGMGASREAGFSALAEPVTFLAITVLAGLSIRSGGSIEGLTISSLFNGSVASQAFQGRFELFLLPVVYFLLLLVENSRIPADDPTTHLELTMVHEVMILDYSGPDLACIIYASTLKLAFFAGLITGLLVPDLSHLPPVLTVVIHLLSILAVAVLVGIVESCMARVRLHRVFHMLATASAMACLTLILSAMR